MLALRIGIALTVYHRRRIAMWLGGGRTGVEPSRKVSALLATPVWLSTVLGLPIPVVRDIVLPPLRAIANKTRGNHNEVSL